MITCPRRMSEIGPWKYEENLDEWFFELNGDRTCSFCGSLHPDDFINICQKIVNREPGYSLDHSDKSYKVYVRQPNISNASQGGIKFYKQHVEATGEELARQTKVYNEALTISKEEFKKRMNNMT